MKLYMDGHEVTPRAGQSLYDMVRELGMLEGKLSTDPIAAKIAGRIFTLNYIPLRQKDVTPERESVRKAMAAADGVVRLIRYSDPVGRDTYARTAQFVLFLAIRRLWPHATAKMNCTVGAGAYIKVTGAEDFSVDALIREVEAIVAEDFLLLRRRIPTAEAIAYYTERGQFDKARLFSYREKVYMDVYERGDYMEYFHGEMAPSTGYLRSYAILPAPEGFIFVYPNVKNPDRVSTYRESPNFFQVYTEGKRWGELMRCETVADLNEMVDSGEIRELIRVNEALHEKRFSEIADMICERGAKAVMLAGPSSSGKTTSANRLATQLRVHGKLPILMSLDDYYIDRDKIAPGPDGQIDLEHINTLDCDLFRQDMARLLQGEEIELPYFNFKTGRREWRGHKMQLHPDSVIIVEGLHALNPQILPEGLAPHMIFKLFVSPLLPLNLDDHNRIRTTDVRLLRRIVRDNQFRSTPPEETLAMWPSVRKGEETWIFPHQERADSMFNTALHYELPVLGHYAYKLLRAIPPENPNYLTARRLVKMLNYFPDVPESVLEEIPPLSLLREFIGGCTIEKEG